MNAERWSRDTEMSLTNVSPRVPAHGQEAAKPHSSVTPSPEPAQYHGGIHGQRRSSVDSFHRPQQDNHGLGLTGLSALHRAPSTVDEEDASDNIAPTPSPFSSKAPVMSRDSTSSNGPVTPATWNVRGSGDGYGDDNIDDEFRPRSRPTVARNRNPIFGGYYDLNPVLVRRHILMICISGTIGMGIFVTSGQVLQLAGSFGALLVYIFTGLVVHSVMACLGEMVALIPEAGALQEYPTRFFDEALGWTVAGAYWFTYAMGVATLTTSTAIFVSYWHDSDGGPFPVAWVITLILLVVIGISVFGIELYGEIEYVSGLLKVILVVGLVILMLCINRGAGQTGEVYGAKYWSSSCRFSNRFPTNGTASDVPQWVCTDQTPRPPLSSQITGSTGEFLSIWKGITLATFSFIGVELVAVTASEAKFPRDDLPKATRRVFWLTFGLYIFAIFFVSLNVPYTDWRLWPQAEPSPKASPFIIAIEEAGIKVLPGFVNACMLFASWSTTNTQLFVASRTLYGMATRLSVEAHPHLTVLAQTTKKGVPMMAIFASCIFVPLAYLQCGEQSSKELLQILSQIQTVACLIVWMCQCLAFIRFYNGLQSGGAPHDRQSDDYPYRSSFQPWKAYFGFISCFLLVLFNGFDVFVIKPWHTQIKFLLADYLAFVIIPVAYLAVKAFNRVPIVSLGMMKYSVRREAFDRRRQEVPKSKLRRFLGWIFG